MPGIAWNGTGLCRCALIICAPIGPIPYRNLSALLALCVLPGAGSSRPSLPPGRAGSELQIRAHALGRGDIQVLTTPELIVVLEQKAKIKGLGPVMSICAVY